MNKDQVWKIVRVSLPGEIVREVEEQRLETLAECVTLVSTLVERDAWPLWRDALYAWARGQTDARDALRELTDLDLQLGVWCACQVVRTVVQYTPAGGAPGIAIETAERWVRGQDTRDACLAAAQEAWGCWQAATTLDLGDAAMAASHAAFMASSGMDDQDSTYHAASAASEAASAYTATIWSRSREAAWNNAFKVRLRSLNYVVADAIVTMPWEATT